MVLNPSVNSGLHPNPSANANQQRQGITNKGTVWTVEMIFKEVSKFSTLKHYCLCSPSDYEAAERRGILKYICKHMKAKYKNNIWTEKML